jgi:predicted 2-oxoglutarate/Fe(II)-dependent dioxygenase YbiX
MCDQLSAFKVDKYVHLKEFLDLESCEQLTAELKKLVEKGATQKDNQCPMSEAVHGAPVFDSLMEQLLPNFEAATGKKLYPTYAYARLYQPGDELKPHTDRAACEITASVTLGFDGKPWAIYMGDYAEQGREVKDSGGDVRHLVNETEIVAGVGDAVLFRGMDKVHWRNPYKEGNWQAQVFLHYVDAEGPHAEWKYDKRECLSHHKIDTMPDLTFWVFPDVLTKEACQKIVDGCNAGPLEKAGIGGSKGVIDTEIRDVNRVPLPVYKGIAATMAGMALHANQQAWKFDLTHANQSEFLRYDKEGHYYAHIDTFITKPTNDCRKLTALLFLNDDFEGGKLFIQDGHNKRYPPQTPGTVIVFPSFLMHGVENVTKGVRYSLVTWMVGPSFR